MTSRDSPIPTVGPRNPGLQSVYAKSDICACSGWFVGINCGERLAVLLLEALVGEDHGYFEAFEARLS